MFLKVISCEVFTREICYCVARSPHVVDMEFTEKGAHDKSDYLRQVIQERIDAAQRSPKGYDAILLAYGLCGNGTVNLRSRQTKLIIPRAHDCCTLFLGSKIKFKNYFAENPSQPFSANGYAERSDSYVHEANVRTILGLTKSYEEYAQLYGEENAKYIFDTLAPCFQEDAGDKLIFIDVPEMAPLRMAAQIEAKAQAEGKKFFRLQGDIGLIQNLLFGHWGSEDFLVVQPRQRITGVYDWDEVIRAVDDNEEVVTGRFS